MRAARPVRIPNTPLLVGKTWLFPNGDRVKAVRGGATDEPAGPTVVPEDLTVITDEDLTSLEDQLVAEFDDLYDSDSRDNARLVEIGTAIKAVRGEKTVRKEQDDAAAEEAKRIHDEVHGAATDPAEGEGDEGGDPQPDPAADPDPAGDAATDPAKDPALVAAGARPNRGRRPSASETARHAGRPAVPAAAPVISITAAAGLPVLSPGTVINMTQVAESMHDVARGLQDRSGKKNVARFNIAQPRTDVITKATSPEAGEVIIDRLTSPSRFAARAGNGAEGLVAAGGWCTPSQNLYDLLALDAATGLLDLPSVGIERGGVNIPSYIGIDAADGALWHWDDGKDANIVITITDLDIAGGVGTATNSGTNRLEVGDMVDLQTTNLLANGPHTVTAVASPTSFTLNMTGVPDATNATGTGTRQKGCFRIPCPTWGDVRLEAYGLCINHGNLTDKAFPELTRRYASLVVNAHMHRMSAVHLAKIRSTAHSDLVTITAIGTDAYGDIMSGIELSIVDYRSQYKISDRVVLEVLLPTWVKEQIRATLSMRAGVDLLAVTDAQIMAFFTVRNTRPQFLEDYQAMWNGIPRTAWPTAVEAVIYPAGDFFEGNGGTIDLAVARDSTLNKTNDFTVAFTEDFRLLGRRGPKARRIAMTVSTDGITACCP